MKNKRYLLVLVVVVAFVSTWLGTVVATAMKPGLARESIFPQIVEEESITFFHVADTHIISAAGTRDIPDCQPSGGSRDGRTDCRDIVSIYGDPTVWLDPVSGHPNAPTKALEDLVSYANVQMPAFLVIGGDLISNGLGCDADALASYQKFNALVSGLTVPWYAVGSGHHDIVSDPVCLAMYKQYVSPNPNWTFTVGNNLFIGASDMNQAETDEDFIDNALDSYANKNYKVFIFTHSAAECYDEWYGGDYRCQNLSSFGPMLRTHTDEYKSIVVLSGHNHANVYDTTDAAQNLHHITTSAVMNYPTQARVVQITGDQINISMTPSLSPDIDALSLAIINGIGIRDPRTFYGSAADRNISISASAPPAGGNIRVR